MKIGVTTMACGLLFSFVAGCAPAPEPLPYISDKALAALPPGTDLYTVGRRDDGCYYIQTEDGLSGYLTLLRDPSGQQVCDEV